MFTHKNEQTCSFFVGFFIYMIYLWGFKFRNTAYLLFSDIIFLNTILM